MRPSTLITLVPLTLCLACSEPAPPAAETAEPSEAPPVEEPLEEPPPDEPSDEPGEPTEAQTQPPSSEWRRVAALASSPESLLERALAGLTPRARAALEGLFTRMEASGRGVEAVLAAGALAEAGADGMNDGAQPRTGMPAGSAAAHTVGLALLEGMLIESARAEPSSVGALAAAVCRMRLPRTFNGGGQVSPSRDQWRLRNAVHATLPEGERPPTPDCPP